MKTPVALQRACEVLRARVRFKSASLTLPGNPFGQDDTQIVRDATRVYVESWIIPILNCIERGDLRLLQEVLSTFEIGDKLENES